MKKVRFSSEAQVIEYPPVLETKIAKNNEIFDIETKKDILPEKNKSVQERVLRQNTLFITKHLISNAESSSKKNYIKAFREEEASSNMTKIHLMEVSVRDLCEDLAGTSQKPSFDYHPSKSSVMEVLKKGTLLVEASCLTADDFTERPSTRKYLISLNDLNKIKETGMSMKDIKNARAIPRTSIGTLPAE